MRHKIGYWNNYDNCYNEAKKYDCRNDFHNMCRKAYNSARNNGWINDYTWFKKHLHADDNYEIYAYEDRTNKIVYVGLTYRLFGNGGNNRHNEHKSKNDPVGNYFNGVIPTPRRLMSELTPEDAQYYEDWYRRKYEENGWKTLNTAKTGVGSSSLGGVNIVWNYDTCLEEAKKYEKAARFKDGNPSAYRVAANNGWIKEWFPDMKMPNGYWNYEHCKEEAEKYTTREDFYNNDRRAYAASSRMGLLGNFTWLAAKKNDAGYWTEEKCYEAAKKCSTLREFITAYSCAYNKANRNGWLDNYFWLDRACKPNNYWNYDTCHEIAKTCKSRGKFKEKNMVAYTKARTNGWLDDWFPKNNRKPAGYWNYEHCKEEVSKYQNRKELNEANKSVYNVCVKNKWLDEFFPIAG